MGHIRNQKFGEKLAHSLLSSCGKCPECGHYLTIKADYKKESKNFITKKVCINRHFGCNYEEDISKDFNNALGLKSVFKKNKNDLNYTLGVSLSNNKVNSYVTTGTLKRSVYGEKELTEFFWLEPIVREFIEREMGDIKKCESCNEEFHYYVNKRRDVYELVCPCCDATVDISDFIRYDSFLKGKIDRIDLLNFFNITSINDCKIKWRYI